MDEAGPSMAKGAVTGFVARCATRADAGHWDELAALPCADDRRRSQPIGRDATVVATGVPAVNGDVASRASKPILRSAGVAGDDGPPTSSAPPPRARTRPGRLVGAGRGWRFANGPGSLDVRVPE
jgi:hypothetical protein